MFKYSELSEAFTTTVNVNDNVYHLSLVKQLGKTDIVVMDSSLDSNGCVFNVVFKGKTVQVKQWLESQKIEVMEQSKPVVKVGFARVSTKEQDLTAQVKALKEQGITDSNLFASKHSGKAETNKAALDSLLERVKLMADSGMTVQVIVVKLDRLGRSMGQVLNTVDSIHKLGGSLIALEQNIDTSKGGIETTMMLGMFSMFAEMERQFIYERTQGARQAIGDAANGGRPTIQSDALTAKALELKGQGIPMTTIAKQLEISRATLYRMLENK